LELLHRIPACLHFFEKFFTFREVGQERIQIYVMFSRWGLQRINLGEVLASSIESGGAVEIS
jgi:hypothetical protein